MTRIFLPILMLNMLTGSIQAMIMEQATVAEAVGLSLTERMTQIIHAMYFGNFPRALDLVKGYGCITINPYLAGLIVKNECIPMVEVLLENREDRMGNRLRSALLFDSLPMTKYLCMRLFIKHHEECSLFYKIVEDIATKAGGTKECFDFMRGFLEIVEEAERSNRIGQLLNKLIQELKLHSAMERGDSEAVKEALLAGAPCETDVFGIEPRQKARDLVEKYKNDPRYITIQASIEQHCANRNTPLSSVVPTEILRLLSQWLL